MTGWRKRTIMEMAREAWVEAGEGWVVDAWFDGQSKAFEAFAKLVREDERKKFLGHCANCTTHTHWQAIQTASKKGDRHD